MLEAENGKTATPAVSVIVPAYNIEEWLGECVESILAQTFRDFELIIVDDGSTDRTAAVAARYAAQDKRVRVIRKENEGPGEARNAGVRKAQGRWITFVDGDDLIHPEMLMTLTRCAKNTESLLVSVSMKRFYDAGYMERVKGSATRQLHMCKDIKRLYYRRSPMQAVRKMLYQTGWLDNSVWGKLYDATLWRNMSFPVGLYEDLEVVPRVYMRAAEIYPDNDVIHIPLDFYYYRQREESIIHTWSPRRLDVLKVTERLCKELPERDASLKKAADDRRLSACFNMFLEIERNKGICDNNSNYPENEESPESKVLNEASDLCWREIRRLRMQSLFNPRVRFKNKAGILASLLGRRFLRLLAK